MLVNSAKFVKPWVSSISPNVVIPPTMIRPRDQNALERLVRRVLLATGRWPGGWARTRWRDYLSDFASSGLVLGPTGLSDTAKSREVIQGLGLLPPRPPGEEKPMWKWMVEQKKNKKMVKFSHLYKKRLLCCMLSSIFWCERLWPGTALGSSSPQASFNIYKIMQDLFRRFSTWKPRK